MKQNNWVIGSLLYFGFEFKRDEIDINRVHFLEDWLQLFKGWDNWQDEWDHKVLIYDKEEGTIDPTTLFKTGMRYCRATNLPTNYAIRVGTFDLDIYKAEKYYMSCLQFMADYPNRIEIDPDQICDHNLAQYEQEMKNLAEVCGIKFRWPEWYMGTVVRDFNAGPSRDE